MLSRPSLHSQIGSLTSPSFNFDKIIALFGRDRAHPLYDLFPEAALVVTDAFLRTINSNRFGKFLTPPTEDLTASERSLKSAWENTFAKIVDSITVSQMATERCAGAAI